MARKLFKFLIIGVLSAFAITMLYRIHNALYPMDKLPGWTLIALNAITGILTNMLIFHKDEDK